VKKLIIFAQLVLLMFATGRNPSQNNETEAGFSVGAILLQYTLGERPSVYTYNNHIYFATNRGVFYFYGHTQRWNHPHTKEEAILVGEGPYIALWQPGHNEAMIFEPIGYSFTLNLGWPILNLTINSQGYTSVIMEHNEVYYIFVIDSYGQEIFATTISDINIFPTGVALNRNLLAVSLLDANHPNISSHVMFFDTSQGAIGATNLEQSIISTIQFAGDVLFVVSPTKLMAIDNGLNILWEKEKHIQDIVFDSALVAVLTYDGVSFFNHRGYRLWHYNPQAPVTYFGGGLNHVIIGKDRQFFAIDSAGNTQWEFVSIPEPLELHFLNSIQRILLKTPIEGQLLEK